MKTINEIKKFTVDSMCEIRQLVKFHRGVGPFPENFLSEETVVGLYQLAHEPLVPGIAIAPAKLYKVDIDNRGGVLAHGHLLRLNERVGIVLTLIPPEDIYYEYHGQARRVLPIEELGTKPIEAIKNATLIAFKGIPNNQLRSPSKEAKKLI